MKKHLKMIVSVNDGAREEIVVESGDAPGAKSMIAFSALYGDGSERYLDVTEIVQNFGNEWPENWEELVYGGTKLQHRSAIDGYVKVDKEVVVNRGENTSLKIHSAYYGIGDSSDKCIDVAPVLQRKVVNNSLDICVTNDDLEVGNPFRGLKKKLWVCYSYDGGEQVVVIKEERGWLIIGQSARYVKQFAQVGEFSNKPSRPFPKLDAKGSGTVGNELFKVRLEPTENGSIPVVIGLRELKGPMAVAALNDLLIRRFKIPDRRLRGPMPIELRDFHRDDLAVLFAELGFTKGAEIGVAEGNYSEVLLKANPNLHLLLVDPWHAYSSNPQNKSKEKNEYAYNETLRKTAAYPNVKLDMRYSMDAVRDVADDSLDFVYIDAHHSYPFVMEDIITWSRKVRSGGIVSGDDVYQLNEKWGAGPMEAVYHYTSAMKINPWWLIAAWKSVDFFWIKP